jgi:DNA-binding protein HU-beta
MKNKDLLKELSIRLNWTTSEVSSAISELGNAISAKLSEGDTIHIDGLGQFETRKKGERISVNPANGKKYLVPPKLTAVFKAGNTLKAKLKGIDNNE